MKKLFIILFIAASYTDFRAQTDNWAVINPGHTVNYGTSKLMVKNNAVYVFNHSFSTLLRSLDNGLTWNAITVPSDSAHHEYNDITFVNDSVGYVAGYEGSLFTTYGIVSVVKKTTDRGLTWQKMGSGFLNNSILTNISFINESHGMVFGTGNMQTYRFVTEDGGLNWTYLPNFGPDMHQVNSSDFMGQEGVAAGIGHYMHLAVTHDEGSTWETKHFHGSSSVNGLKFFNSQNGIVVANDSIFTTYDGASTFAAKTKFPYAGFIKSFDMLDMQRGFFCSDHQIYYTADGGNSWTLSYSNNSIELVNIKIEGTNVFASTRGNGTILKLDITDRVVGISKEASGKNGLKIYPNPTTDKVYITAPVGENLVSAVVIDQLGRLVKKQSLADTKTLAVGELSPGSYVIEITSSAKTYVNKLIIQQK